MCILQDEMREAGMSGFVDQRTDLKVRSVSTSLAALAARFKRDDEGSVAMMFGLMVIPCVMFVGIAVDYGRILSVKQQAQGILDNAVLAGGRAAQTATSNYDTVAQTAAAAFFAAQNIAHTTQSTISGVASNANKSEFEWTATSWVATPFLSAAEILKSKPAEVGAPTACATSGWQCQKITVKASALLKAGGTNNDTNIETSIMLDVTGSMEGQKFTDMKVAAKDLIDIIVWDDQSNVKSRVAIAPFAEAVNVGTDLITQVRGAVTPGTCNNNSPGCESFKFNKAGGGSNDWRTYKISNSCVVARQGSNKWTDAAPSTSPVEKAYLSGSGSCGMVNADDPETNLIMPLSNSKVALKQRIDKLDISGSTAGHIGTAWAWYLLSPSWNYLFPSSSAAGSYTDTKVKKIAVLMTDGEYNTQYCKGVEAKDSYSPKINCNGDGADADAMAQKLCDGMKDKNITVYTVGFQAPTSAKTFLKKCATSESHYYDATSGDALKMAFRDIALKISSLRLSK
jgi:Flp pilus assembly protein TadG